MNEASFWEYLQTGMVGRWDATRIETGSTGNGVPDVAYSVPKKHGWIELKYIPHAPKRATTPPDLRHFTPLQQHWLMYRGKLAGNCWVFIRMADEFFLFDWTQARVITKLPYGEWEEHAKLCAKTKLDFDYLYHVLLVGCAGIY